MDNNSLTWIMGSFNFNGVEMPVATVIASFNEAKVQFEIELSEMEDDVAKYAANNPNKEYAVKKMEGRINRLRNIIKSYEYMIAYHKDQVKQAQRIRMEEKRKDVENVLGRESNPIHIKQLLTNLAQSIGK